MSFEVEPGRKKGRALALVDEIECGEKGGGPNDERESTELLVRRRVRERVQLAEEDGRVRFDGVHDFVGPRCRQL